MAHQGTPDVRPGESLSSAGHNPAASNPAPHTQNAGPATATTGSGIGTHHPETGNTPQTSSPSPSSSIDPTRHTNDQQPNQNGSTQQPGTTTTATGQPSQPPGTTPTQTPKSDNTTPHTFGPAKEAPGSDPTRSPSSENTPLNTKPPLSGTQQDLRQPSYVPKTSVESSSFPSRSVEFPDTGTTIERHVPAGQNTAGAEGGHPANGHLGQNHGQNHGQDPKTLGQPDRLVGPATVRSSGTSSTTTPSAGPRSTSRPTVSPTTPVMEKAPGGEVARVGASGHRVPAVRPQTEFEGPRALDTGKPHENPATDLTAPARGGARHPGGAKDVAVPIRQDREPGPSPEVSVSRPSGNAESRPASGLPHLKRTPGSEPSSPFRLSQDAPSSGLVQRESPARGETSELALQQEEFKQRYPEYWGVNGEKYAQRAEGHTENCQQSVIAAVQTRRNILSGNRVGGVTVPAPGGRPMTIGAANEHHGTEAVEATFEQVESHMAGHTPGAMAQVYIEGRDGMVHVVLAERAAAGPRHEGTKPVQYLDPHRGVLPDVGPHNVRGFRPLSDLGTTPLAGKQLSPERLVGAPAGTEPLRADQLLTIPGVSEEHALGLVLGDVAREVHKAAAHGGVTRALRSYLSGKHGVGRWHVKRVVEAAAMDKLRETGGNWPDQAKVLDAYGIGDEDAYRLIQAAAVADLREAADHGRPYSDEELAAKYGQDLAVKVRGESWVDQVVFAAALADVRAAVESGGRPYSAGELARRYGRTPQWARKPILTEAALREELSKSKVYRQLVPEFGLSRLDGHGEVQPAGALEQLARAEVRAAVGRGEVPNAEALARRYGKSREWGRLQIDAAAHIAVIEAMGARRPYSAERLAAEFGLDVEQARARILQAPVVEAVGGHAAKQAAKEAAAAGNPLTAEDLSGQYGISFTRAEKAIDDAAGSDIRRGLAEGKPVTEKDLARRYGKDEAWARDRIDAQLREAIVYHAAQTLLQDPVADDPRVDIRSHLSFLRDQFRVSDARYGSQFDTVASAEFQRTVLYGSDPRIIRARRYLHNYQETADSIASTAIRAYARWAAGEGVPFSVEDLARQLRWDLDQESEEHRESVLEFARNGISAAARMDVEQAAMLGSPYSPEALAERYRFEVDTAKRVIATAARDHARAMYGSVDSPGWDMRHSAPESLASRFAISRADAERYVAEVHEFPQDADEEPVLGNAELYDLLDRAEDAQQGERKNVADPLPDVIFDDESDTSSISDSGGNVVLSAANIEFRARFPELAGVNSQLYLFDVDGHTKNCGQSFVAAVQTLKNNRSAGAVTGTVHAAPGGPMPLSWLAKQLRVRPKDMVEASHAQVVAHLSGSGGVVAGHRGAVWGGVVLREGNAPVGHMVLVRRSANGELTQADPHRGTASKIEPAEVRGYVPLRELGSTPMAGPRLDPDMLVGMAPGAASPRSRSGDWRFADAASGPVGQVYRGGHNAGPAHASASAGGADVPVAEAEPGGWEFAADYRDGDLIHAGSFASPADAKRYFDAHYSDLLLVNEPEDGVVESALETLGRRSNCVECTIAALNTRNHPGTVYRAKPSGGNTLEEIVEATKGQLLGPYKSLAEVNAAARKMLSKGILQTLLIQAEPRHAMLIARTRDGRVEIPDRTNRSMWRVPTNVKEFHIITTDPKKVIKPPVPTPVESVLGLSAEDVAADSREIPWFSRNDYEGPLRLLVEADLDPWEHFRALRELCRTLGPFPDQLARVSAETGIPAAVLLRFGAETGLALRELAPFRAVLDELNGVPMDSPVFGEAANRFVTKGIPGLVAGLGWDTRAFKRFLASGKATHGELNRALGRLAKQHERWSEGLFDGKWARDAQVWRLRELGVPAEDAEKIAPEMLILNRGNWFTIRDFTRLVAKVGGEHAAAIFAVSRAGKRIPDDLSDLGVDEKDLLAAAEVLKRDPREVATFLTSAGRERPSTQGGREWLDSLHTEYSRWEAGQRERLMVPADMTMFEVERRLSRNDLKLAGPEELARPAFREGYRPGDPISEDAFADLRDAYRYAVTHYEPALEVNEPWPDESRRDLAARLTNCPVVAVQVAKVIEHNQSYEAEGSPPMPGWQIEQAIGKEFGASFPNFAAADKHIRAVFKPGEQGLVSFRSPGGHRHIYNFHRRLSGSVDYVAMQRVSKKLGGKSGMADLSIEHEDVRIVKLERGGDYRVPRAGGHRRSPARGARYQSEPHAGLDSRSGTNRLVDRPSSPPPEWESRRVARQLARPAWYGDLLADEPADCRARAEVLSDVDAGLPVLAERLAGNHGKSMEWALAQVDAAARADLLAAKAAGLPYSTDELAYAYGKDEGWATKQAEATDRASQTAVRTFDYLWNSLTEKTVPELTEKIVGSICDAAEFAPSQRYLTRVRETVRRRWEWAKEKTRNGEVWVSGVRRLELALVVSSVGPSELRWLEEEFSARLQKVALRLLEFPPNFELMKMQAKYHGEDKPGNRRYASLGTHVKYFTEEERKAYLITVGPDGLLYDSIGRVFDTTGRGSGGGDKFIFVMDEEGVLYSAKKSAGELQHSSFLSGGDTAGAGYIRVETGRLLHIIGRSGHYRPMEKHVMQTVDNLVRQGAEFRYARIQVLKS
ncbi:hypothetical protein [Amycolatopsis sp. NPDC058986]|uniref:hypothetical protein n=1 Tax=Amycolatopsis sp. NPDC058986 TaxID=3346685 RepID=UPI00366EACC6